MSREVCQTDNNQYNTDDSNDTVSSIRTSPGTTQYSRARWVCQSWSHVMQHVSVHKAIIANGLLIHSPSLGVFTVIGTGGNANAVRLYPKESCSCPSTTRCYHILAARMSVGLEADSCLTRKVNLTELRRNTTAVSICLLSNSNYLLLVVIYLIHCGRLSVVWRG